MSDESRTSLFRRVVTLTAYLCLVLAGLFVVARMWVLPWFVRSRATAWLNQVWSGTVEIEDVEVGLFGPSFVRGVRIRDNLGRTWATVSEIRVKLAWDGFVPRAQAVRVSMATISPQCAGGKCVIPLKESESDGPPPDPVQLIEGLKGLDVHVGLVAFRPVYDDSPEAREFEGISLPANIAGAISQTGAVLLDINWTGGKLSVSESPVTFGDDFFSIRASGDLESKKSFVLGGRINGLAGGKKLTATFGLTLNRGRQGRFEADVAEPVVGDIQGYFRRDGAGQTTFNFSVSKMDPKMFKFTAGLHEIPRLAMTGADIEARIKATVKPGQPVGVSGTVGFVGPLGRAIAKGRGEIDGKGVRWIIADVDGQACEGQLDANIKVDRIGDKPARIRIKGKLKQAKMPDLVRMLFPGRTVDRGLGSAGVNISFLAWDSGSITGKGSVLLDNTDPRAIPIISDLFGIMNIRLSNSDIRGEFDLKGPTASITKGHLASTLWAVNFQKGGTIDLETGKIDMHALFLPVKQAGPVLDLFKKINPLNLLVEKDSLERIAEELFLQHVTGTIDKPVIRPVVIRDVSRIPAGAFDLLKNVAQAGGQLGAGVLNAILNIGN